MYFSDSCCLSYHVNVFGSSTLSVVTITVVRCYLWKLYAQLLCYSAWHFPLVVKFWYHQMACLDFFLIPISYMECASWQWERSHAAAVAGSCPLMSFTHAMVFSILLTVIILQSCIFLSLVIVFSELALKHADNCLGRLQPAVPAPCLFAMRRLAWKVDFLCFGWHWHLCSCWVALAVFSQVQLSSL